MSPFDINPENDAGHAIDQDDIIAFHLHELTPPQERAFHRALRTNPALQAESLAVAATLNALPRHEPLPSSLNAATTTNRIWNSLRPSLIPYVPVAATPFAFLKLPVARWAIPTLAASTLIAITALLVVSRHLHNSASTTATIAAPPGNIFVPSAQQLPPPTTAPPGSRNSYSMAQRHVRSDTSALIQTASTNPVVPAQPTIRSVVPPQSPASSTVPPSNLFAQLDPVPPALRQPPGKSDKPLRAPRSHRSASNELTFSIFGDVAVTSRATLTYSSGASAASQSVSQSPGATVGALASFRQQFGPSRGYRLTGTYVSQSSGSKSLQNYEIAGTYVLQGPHHGRLTTSAEAGAALVATTYDNSRTYHPAAVLGVGSEVAFSRHWGLRAEYRAQFYKSPAVFSAIAPLGISVSSSNNTFDSDAIVGVTYLFGHKRND
jgi:hypothetical protein